jgi:hypothetical protein
LAGKKADQTFGPTSGRRDVRRTPALVKKSHPDQGWSPYLRKYVDSPNEALRRHHR